MSELTALESAVLQKLFSGDSPALTALRRQLEMAMVVSREMTGVGFFLTFAIPKQVPAAPVPPGELHFGDVQADVSGLKHGVGFLVFIEDGKLRELEGYTYDEPWPDRVDHFELHYTDPKRTSAMRALAAG